MHEAQMNEENCFITLTYAPRHLRKVPYESLDPKVSKAFIERLKYRIKPTKIKYLLCGEYGPNKTHRPHYHAIIFGYNFPDLELCGKSSSGKPIFSSKILKELWPYGRSTVQPVNYKTCCYVAKYTTKMDKRSKKRQDFKAERRPEFSRQSPSLGLSFFEKYWSDMYPSDDVCIRGDHGIYTVKPPRYYDKKYEEMNPRGFLKLKKKRAVTAYKNRHDSTPARLAVKEEIAMIKAGHSPRDIE